MAGTDADAKYFKTLASIETPRIMYVLGWMLTIGFLVLVIFLIFTPWVQTSYGVGSITALNPNDRLQEVNALVSGRIQEWFVQDGSRVKVGDPIVRIVDNDPKLLERLEAERHPGAGQARRCGDGGGDLRDRYEAHAGTFRSGAGRAA